MRRANCAVRTETATAELGPACQCSDTRASLSFAPHRPACAQHCAPPTPDRPPSEWSDDGSLGDVVDLGYRDPREGYSRNPESTTIVKGDIVAALVGVGAIEVSIERPACSGQVASAALWTTGGLLFGLPTTCASRAIDVTLEVLNGTLYATVDGCYIKIRKTSDLDLTAWYECRKIDWASWIHALHSMMKELGELIRAGKVTVDECADCECFIAFDAPLPVIDGENYLGAGRTIRFKDRCHWNSRCEALRGSYGPVHLVREVIVPEWWPTVHRRLRESDLLCTGRDMLSAQGEAGSVYGN